MSRFRKLLLPVLSPVLCGAGLVVAASGVAGFGLVTRAEAEAVAAPEGDAAVTAAASSGAAVVGREGGYGLGRAPLPEEIAAWDTDIRPDGVGLPEGSGDVASGEETFVEKCAVCHGDFGEAVDRWPQLAGGFGSLTHADPVKTVGSYWPYLSTVWDYVHRAMPFGDAQSLTNDEVYGITAYLLYLNDQVDDDFVLSKANFTEVVMPNAEGFFPDDRATAELPQFSAEVCMENCKPSVEITMRAAVIDVTPGDSSDDGGAEPADPAK